VVTPIFLQRNQDLNLEKGKTLIEHPLIAFLNKKSAITDSHILHFPILRTDFQPCAGLSKTVKFLVCWRALECTPTRRSGQHTAAYEAASALTSEAPPVAQAASFTSPQLGIGATRICSWFSQHDCSMASRCRIDAKVRLKRYSAISASTSERSGRLAITITIWRQHQCKGGTATSTPAARRKVSHWR
jgi:hypothetical protein